MYARQSVEGPRAASPVLSLYLLATYTVCAFDNVTSTAYGTQGDMPREIHPQAQRYSMFLSLDATRPPGPAVTIQAHDLSMVVFVIPSSLSPGTKAACHWQATSSESCHVTYCIFTLCRPYSSVLRGLSRYATKQIELPIVLDICRPVHCDVLKVTVRFALAGIRTGFATATLKLTNCTSTCIPIAPCVSLSHRGLPVSTTPDAQCSPTSLPLGSSRI